jgi:hypothetical protein
MFSHFIAALLMAQTPTESPQPTSATPAAPIEQAAPATSPPESPAAAPAVPEKLAKNPDFQMNAATLNRLHVEGIVNDATYYAAMKDLIEVGNRAGASPALTAGGFSAIMYGFAEADAIFDTTQSFFELPGDGSVAKQGTIGGSNGRTIFSIRNSRLGFRIGAPKFGDFTASAILETDFLGNQPTNPPAVATVLCTTTPCAPGTATSLTGTPSNGYREGPYFTNPTLRARQFLGKLDSPYFNFWFGQTWALVGWQPYFQPNTLEIQGIPGELYSRTPQFRLSHDVDLSGATVGIAVAALRPPQMDAQIPDFQGAIKLSLDDWKGVQTVGSTGTTISSAALVISGAVRQYKLPQGTTEAAGFQNATGLLAAADILIPILPAKQRREWAVTLLAETTIGTGDADQFTALTGGAGVQSPTPPLYSGTTPYGTVADVDPGLVGWNTNVLQTVDWETLMLNLQIYLPPEGKLWLSGTYTTSYSDNVALFNASRANVTNHINYWDVSLWWDIIPGVRMAGSFIHTRDTYANGALPYNNRVQYAAFFIF